MSQSDIAQWLADWQYALLFPLAVVEGPIVTFIAGFLARQGSLHLPLIYPVVVFADLCADSAYYAVGRRGGRGFIDRWGRYLHVSERSVLRLEGHFRQHAGKTLLLGKLTMGMGPAILVAAGIGKTNYRTFLVWNLVATLPKSLAFLMLGFYFGYAYEQINRYLGYATAAVIAMAAVAAVGFYIAAKKRAVRGGI